MRSIPAAAWTGLALLAGCLLPSTDGLSSQDGGVAVDASVDACVGCLDASNPDVVTVADTGSDATDAAPQPFCAGLSPAPVFCEDFDTSVNVAAQFTNSHTSTLGTLTADTTAFTSPPRSLHAQLPAAVTSTDYAFLTRVFTGAPTEIDYAFDVRLDALVAGQTSVLGTVVLGEGTPAEHRIAFVAIDGDFFLEESFPADAGNVFIDTLVLAAGLPKGIWKRVGVHLSIGTHTAKAFLDGKVAKVFSLHPSWSAALPQVDLGYTYVSKQSSAWSIHLDNVVYDAK